MSAHRPRRYSALRHVAWSVWHKHDPATHHMLILSAKNRPTTALTECTAYCDASGTRNEPLLFVAGFASSEAKWVEFEERWAALMDEFQIKKPFHTTEYWMGTGDDYAQFKRNDARRVEFETRVYPIIKQTARLPLSFGAQPPELRAALQNYVVPDVYQTAFATCGLQAIYSGLNWMRKHRSGHDRVDALKFVFEDGDGDKGAFMDAVLNLTGERLLFDVKEQVPQFAIADILGWRHARYEKTNYTRATDRHDCFFDLASHVPRENCLMLNQGGFEKTFEEFGFPRRQ